MIAQGVTALSNETTHFRLVWTGNKNNPDNVTHFDQGQFWTLEQWDGTGDPEDDANWSVVPGYNNNLKPKPDLANYNDPGNPWDPTGTSSNGLGDGDEYIVFEVENGNGKHLIFDLNGGSKAGSGKFSSTPQDYTYTSEDERGDLGAGENDGRFHFEHASGPIPCFARGTMIDTPQGPRAVEDLSVGDEVITADHGVQTIRWIGSKLLSSFSLARAPHNRPIRIKAGALGKGIPTADLMVSPQHRVLVRSKTAQKMFGTDEILVAAKQLLQLDGIDIAEDVEEVEYFHILFDRHEVIFSNGAATESLYTGPMALKSVGRAAQREIFELFPELKDRDYTPAGARVLASGRMARKLAVRHKRNLRPLVN